ncbi:MAG: hypothetical protein ACKPKO_10565, partial [Candidatus Fonsibacter sp.]
TPIELLEDALDLIGRLTGCERKPSIQQAKMLLREGGHCGTSLASRLGRLSKGRNVCGHPDVSLLGDIERVLSGLDHGPEGKGRLGPDEDQREQSTADSELRSDHRDQEDYESKKRDDKLDHELEGMNVAPDRDQRECEKRDIMASRERDQQVPDVRSKELEKRGNKAMVGRPFARPGKGRQGEHWTPKMMKDGIYGNSSEVKKEDKKENT